MKKPLQSKIIKHYQLIENFEEVKFEKIQITIENQIFDTIEVISSTLNQDPKRIPQKIILSNEVEKDIGVNFGTQRLKDEIKIANWILEIQSKSRNYLLSFIILKESFLCFLEERISELDEAIINIIAILTLVDSFEISTLDNPLLSAIRSKIYSEEIAGRSNAYWDKLLVLLMKKNLDYLEILYEYLSIYKNNKLTTDQKIKLFSDWVIKKTITPEVVISPIYTNSKLIELIEALLKYGYKRSTTSFIARKFQVSQKTITKRFKALNESYSTYWLSNIDYEKLNLHNYFFTINLAKEKNREKVIQSLERNPYLKSLFHGYDDTSLMLYTPALICPHYISEQIREKLRRMKEKKIIQDFNLQLVREKYQYFSITNFPYNPTINTFKQLISQDDEYLKKYCFLHQKRSSFLPEEDKPIKLDYNLLYFLSIIIGKYLLQARYAVRINEFGKFYRENDIQLTDVKAQTDLLYQNELRARNKGLISFSLFMRNISVSGQEILIFEIPTAKKSNEEIEQIIDKLQVFGFLGQINLYDRYVFQVPGVSHKHPIRNVIKNFLKEEDLPVDFYSIKLLKSKYVPLQDLFDYEKEKWKINIPI